MEPYFADQCRTLTEKIRALREPDDLCFALLAGTALSDFADHTDENIRAVDAQAQFDGVIHLGDILNGSIPETASRFVLSQELARFQTCTDSGKLYTVCGDDDGYRNERYVGQIVTGIVTDERWYQETAYLEQYPDLHRPQNSGHSLCRKAQSPHGAWRSRRCTAYRPPAQVVPNRRRRIRPD